MSDVTVSADDVRLVTDALTIATRNFGAVLVQMPGFGAALEASGRMSVAAEQSALPQDPVSSSKALAIAYSEALREFTEAGFGDEQAFRLVEIQAQAMAQLGLARALHG